MVCNLICFLFLYQQIDKFKFNLIFYIILPTLCWYLNFNILALFDICYEYNKKKTEKGKGYSILVRNENRRKEIGVWFVIN